MCRLLSLGLFSRREGEPRGGGEGGGCQGLESKVVLLKESGVKGFSYLSY